MVMIFDHSIDEIQVSTFESSYVAIYRYLSIRTWLVLIKAMKSLQDIGLRILYNFDDLVL